MRARSRWADRSVETSQSLPRRSPIRRETAFDLRLPAPRYSGSPRPPVRPLRPLHVRGHRIVLHAGGEARADAPREEDLGHRARSRLHRADRARESRRQRDRHVPARRKRSRPRRRWTGRRRRRESLAGLPIAFKDLLATRGVRTTQGSPIFAHNVPQEDHALVARLRAAGAILLGKTNTPEFGAGSQTFNKVFGATRNPYDLAKTCGGSSGGAAAAVACGMLPFADGSDLAASLRNPGNYCNVVGFRPTPGRVPAWPAANAWNTLSVLGPVARTVADCALLLAAMAGPDPRAPTSIAEPGTKFLRPLARDFRKVRVAWSRDLGGLPMDPRVTAALERQRRVFASLGCIVEEAEPDFSGATESFETLRALGVPAESWRALSRPSRQAQGYGSLEHRAGPLAHRREDRPGREPAHGALPSDAPLSRALRFPALPGQPASSVSGRRWNGRAKLPACGWRIISTG